jgi:hypothetical protein
VSALLSVSGFSEALNVFTTFSPDLPICLFMGEKPETVASIFHLIEKSLTTRCGVPFRFATLDDFIAPFFRGLFFFFSRGPLAFSSRGTLS